LRKLKETLSIIIEYLKFLKLPIWEISIADRSRITLEQRFRLAVLVAVAFSIDLRASLSNISKYLA